MTVLFQAEVLALVAPGKFAVIDRVSGDAKQVYVTARRRARLSLRTHPAALGGGKRTCSMIAISRDGRHFVMDGVSR